ncbi:FtsX-like permease family protein [Flavihumibacter sp. R14]|nr:FtsX-like permease family protein [Flavihumibacter soli]
MFKNYLLLALRNLKKQKVFSIINIAGLTVGILSCLMIFLFVQNEFSYDNFHENGNNIYRVMRVAERNGNRETIPYLSPPYATAIKNDYPDAVKTAVRVMPAGGLVSYENVAFNEKEIYFTDADFFSLFDFKLTAGDKKTVLQNPGSVVLTETAAKKYFGKQDPIGKVLILDKELQLKVTGVAKDIPTNSHLNFDLVVPISNYSNSDWFREWNNNNLFTYVQLNPKTDVDKLTGSFTAFMDKYVNEETGEKTGLDLSRLEDIYFESAGPWDQVKHGNLNVVYIFMSIAFLILFIACINFMNLSTARATERSKEVGLRKVLGAVRRQLVFQFIGESILLAAISCLLALGLLQFFMPAFNSLLGYELQGYWKNPNLYVFIAVIIVVIGLLAGSYPAFLLSSFSPVESLKGKLRLGTGGAFFRKVLVVFQFSCTVLLIIGMMIIGSQMNYVRTKNLGFDKERSVVVKLDNNEIWTGMNRFKQQLQNNPSIENVSLMSGAPGGFHDSFTFQVEGMPGDDLQFRTVFADFEYVRTLGLKILAGRDFSPAFPTDSGQAVLINRAAAVKLGVTPEKAPGMRLRNTMRDSVSRTVVGVVENFHFLSLRETIEPMVISGSMDRRVAVIKLKNGDPGQAINAIKKAYTGIAPVYPFEFEFLDQQFDHQYQTDQRQQYILSGFSAIAIFIACLGLFGLASYTAVRRTKEIGVRKVLGSSTQNIVILLSKDLLKPVLLGTLIAIPLGYAAMYQWLQSFAYRTSLHWWVFAVAAITAVLIALITVSFQAVKAATANPVKSLRTE